MSYQIAQFDFRRLTQPEPLAFANDEPSSTFTLLSPDNPGAFLFSLQAFNEFFTWNGYSAASRAISLRSEREEFLFKASRCGSYSATMGSKSLIIDNTTACMIDCHRNTRVDIEGGNESFGFGMSRRSIVSALTHFYGRPAPIGFEFDTEVSMNAPFMKTLENMIALFRHDAFGHQRMRHSVLALAAFEEAIAMFVVENFAHSMSDLNKVDERTIAPRQVRHAMEFAIANAGSPITIADMAALSGVSVRALQMNFKKFINRSPMEFLREERLKRCRAEILAALPTETIADVSAKWGFLHPSRFAALYRRVYGRNPSDDFGSLYRKS